MKAVKVSCFPNKEKEELKIVIAFDKDIKVRNFYLIRKCDDKHIALSNKVGKYHGNDIHEFFKLPPNWNEREYHVEVEINGTFLPIELT